MRGTPPGLALEWARLAHDEGIREAAGQSALPNQLLEAIELALGSGDDLQRARISLRRFIGAANHSILQVIAALELIHLPTESFVSEEEYQCASGLILQCASPDQQLLRAHLTVLWDLRYHPAQFSIARWNTFLHALEQLVTAGSWVAPKAVLQFTPVRSEEPREAWQIILARAGQGNHGFSAADLDQIQARMLA